MGLGPETLPHTQTSQLTLIMSGGARNPAIDFDVDMKQITNISYIQRCFAITLVIFTKDIQILNVSNQVFQVSYRRSAT